MDALKNSITLRVRVPVLSVRTVLTMPSSSLRLDVRATAGVSLSGWYIARSRPMKTKACTTLTISIDT